MQSNSSRLTFVPHPDDITIVEHEIRDTKTRTVVGVELLARFPGRQDADTAAVFAEAEEAERVRELDLACLRSALRYRRRLPNGLKAHVNLYPSTIDFGVVEILKNENRVRPGLVVELHEGKGLSEICGQLAALKPHVTLALDDVGSSCSLLDDLLMPHLDLVKIDRSVLRHVGRDQVAQKRLELLVQMLRSTSLPLVAEGVETENDLAVVRELGIEQAQGFLFGRPATRNVLSRPA